MTSMLRLEPVIENLPSDFDGMRAEAYVEGYRLERLATDWAAGTTRFDRDGEVLLGARMDEILAGIGGLTLDPVVSGALRMRRFYVRPSHSARTALGASWLMLCLKIPAASARSWWSMPPRAPRHSGKRLVSYRTPARGTLTFSVCPPRQPILIDDRRGALSLYSPRQAAHPITLRLVTRMLCWVWAEKACRVGAAAPFRSPLCRKMMTGPRQEHPPAPAASTGSRRPPGAI